MTEEYGSVSSVRFFEPENVRMYDSEGNIALCKCGKPANSGIVDKEGYIVWCEKCSPLYKIKEVINEG